MADRRIFRGAAPMYKAAIGIASLMLMGLATVAQQPVRTAKRPAGKPSARAKTQSAPHKRAEEDEAGEPERLPADRQIAAALKEVSASNIRAIIEKLVSFHSRNTLGSNYPELAAKGEGVVAAR